MRCKKHKWKVVGRNVDQWESFQWCNKCGTVAVVSDDGLVKTRYYYPSHRKAKES
jgi:hypothetical protein